MPRSAGLTPNYGSSVGDRKARHNQLAHLVADVANPDAAQVPVRINQDANIFASELDHGASTTFHLRQGRQAYLICLEGDLNLAFSEDSESCAAPLSLTQHDAAKITARAAGDTTITFSSPSQSGVHFLFVEMKLE